MSNSKIVENLKTRRNTLPPKFRSLMAATMTAVVVSFFYHALSVNNVVNNTGMKNRTIHICLWEKKSVKTVYILPSFQLQDPVNVQRVFQNEFDKTSMYVWHNPVAKYQCSIWNAVLNDFEV